MTDTNEEITLTAEEAASLRQGYRYCPRCRSEMVDRVATEQLGAIQVLGFVLGFFAGIPLVLLLG